MLNVYLLCGHVFETGFITSVEKSTRLTVCPICRREVRIVKAVERVHPPGSRLWVDGAEIQLAVKKGGGR